MADHDRMILRDHQPRSSAPVPSWLSVPVGLLFACGGAALLLFVQGVLPGFRRVELPRPVLSSFALVCAIMGAALLANEARQRWRGARRRRLESSRPGAPWLADHAWDRRRARDQTTRRAMRSLAGALLLGLFLVPFNWLSFFTGSGLPLLGRTLFGLVTVVFDTLALGLLLYGLYLLARRWRHGPSELVFTRFPYLLGETLDARLRGGRTPEAGPLVATLRCVEERYVSGPDDESATTVCDQVYADLTEVSPRPLPGGRGWEAPLGFPLPDAPLGTRLAARPPRYWELEVRARGGEPVYAATFLVPVYAREEPRDPFE